MADSKLPKNTNLPQNRNLPKNSNLSQNQKLAKNSNIKPNKRPTCKVRACKVTLNLNEFGFCPKHTKKGITDEKLYENCRECSYLVKVGDPGITCDKCSIWYHIECVGINNDEYVAIVKDANSVSPKFQWYCRFCKPKCIEAVAKVDLLETQTRNLATKVEKLSERVNNIESNVFNQSRRTSGHR